ncbi:hypothetical protein MG293_015967 [Ovis ammon polii]|uniref:Phosphatidylcholine transfer protein n=1 Tax=Ovis ammon polii TaxID=230172 RepID=A0AAD4Y385_OVIAM|nr:hypothetical protein MG293_015967 [Ovis ammon polii]
MASASRFSEEEFQEACAELQRPRVSGWEIPVVTSVVKVYQRPLKKLTGLHEYKVSGIVRSPPDLLADVYMDLDYRKQWDQYVQEVESKFYKWQECMRMGKRECVYVRQRRDLNFEGRKVYVILAQSISVPWFSEKSGMIRVKQYKQSLAIQSYDSWRSEVFMYYFNNPGGQIPFWILNNFTKQRRELDFRGQKIQVVLAKGTSVPQFPERSGFIRVRQCQVKLAMESDGSNRSKVLIYWFINPGGHIPSWIINLVVKNGIPGFLADLEDACLRY